MSSLFETLTEQLGGSPLDQISQAIGADRSATKGALPGALGSLMGALARNSSKTGGAEALNNALARDHDGSILDDLGGFLTDPRGGGGILDNVLGGDRQSVEAGLSQSSGLDAKSASQLLKLLAPIVLGALGKARTKGSLDAGLLANVLAGERKQVASKAPQGLDMISGLLDSDGDGEFLDDIASKVGSGLVSNLFKS